VKRIDWSRIALEEGPVTYGGVDLLAYSDLFRKEGWEDFSLGGYPAPCYIAQGEWYSHLDPVSAACF
jgi:hypothetical protein